MYGQAKMADIFTHEPKNSLNFRQPKRTCMNPVYPQKYNYVDNLLNLRLFIGLLTLIFTDKDKTQTYKSKFIASVAMEIPRKK